MVQEKERMTLKKLHDTEIMRIYKEQIRKGITANSEQHKKQNEEISDTKWENIKKVVPMVANEVGGYEERKKRMNWYIRNGRQRWK
jgi:hypothetical protein